MTDKIRKAKRYLSRKASSGICKLMKCASIRPAVFPYPTGDGFRSIADHVYDETGKCDPAKIREGQSVFLKSSMIPEWFQVSHPKIAFPYVLISHNSDYNIGEKDIALIDSKIIRWYGQNTKARHPKLIPIPFGLNNLYVSLSERSALYDRLRKNLPVVRKNRIFFSFSIFTNPAERQPAFDFLEKSIISDRPEWIKNPEQYLNTIMGYRFIACPDGNGNDDPRRWQAMYLKLVPIVKRTTSMEYFKSLGLPLWIIDDWKDLAGLTEKDLEKKYEELRSGFESSALWSDYWIGKIGKKEG